MNDFRNMLKDVPGAYEDFVVAMCRFASKSELREDSLRKYILSHPEAGPSDIIGYATFELDLLSDNTGGTPKINNKSIAMA